MKHSSPPPKIIIHKAGLSTLLVGLCLSIVGLLSLFLSQTPSSLMSYVPVAFVLAGAIASGSGIAIMYAFQNKTLWGRIIAIILGLAFAGTLLVFILILGFIIGSYTAD